VALASVYMIRLFIRVMHNRAASAVDSRDVGRLELAVLAPLVAIVVALGVYPQAVLEPTERTTVQKVQIAQGAEAAAREVVP
jgi:NADH-quinone oxidoreductase subunit M